jgi:tetratricopeptide (TPR) repeat protein
VTPAFFLMRRSLLSARLFLFVFGFLVNFCVAQAPRTAPASDRARDTQHALAKAGQCKEALPLLRKAALGSTEKDLKRQAGFACVRCTIIGGSPDTATEFLRVLTRDFPHDSVVLYLSVHTYADFSTRAAQELATKRSELASGARIERRSLKIQGKWDEAAKEYQAVLRQDPHCLASTFSLGGSFFRGLIPPRKDFEQELEIDPPEAGAEYVLRELARQESQWPAAIAHFTRATKLDAAFGDAYPGLDTSLFSSKQAWAAGCQHLRRTECARGVSCRPASP